MKRIRALLSFAVLLSWTAYAQGDLNLVTSNPAGTSLMMDAGTVSLDTMVVSINSDAADLIQGWQTTLLILPTGGTGSVDFNSSVQPSDYVFGTRGAFYSEDLSFPANSDGMFAMDASLDGSFTPVPVPVSGPPGLNLLELDFSASLDASGSFGVFAVGGLGRSEWTDDDINPLLFDNIDPSFDSHTQIGEIVVTPIPAPGAAALALIGLSFVGRLRRRS